MSEEQEQKLKEFVYKRIHPSIPVLQAAMSHSYEAMAEKEDNSIWKWLEKGLTCASESAKSIWAEIKNLFKMVLDAFKSISTRFYASFSYSRQRSWEENGTRVERGRDRLDIHVGVSNNESSQQGAEARSECEGNEELRELAEGFCEKVGKIKRDDEQNNNQMDTDEKLRKLNQERGTQELRKWLEKILELNPSLQ